MTDTGDIPGVEDNDGNTFRGSMAVMGRRFFSPLRGLVLEWKALVIRSFAVLGGLWLIVQVSSHFLAVELRGLTLFLVVLCLAAVLALAWTVHNLWRAVPEGFENESREAQRLAHLRPPLWECRLALSLLRSRLSNIDRDLTDLIQGRTFIKIRSKPKFSEYVRWLQLRPDNLIRMMDVAKRLILVDLTGVLMPSNGTVSSPQTILETIKLIERLYRDAYEFELETRTVQPPAEFVAIHQIQRGWAVSIRDGLQQLTGFLDRIATLDPKASHRVEYEVVFEEPDGIEAFCRELDRIERLPPRDIIGMELDQDL